MKRAIFSPAELAELAAIDAEIEAAPMTQADRDETRLRDQELRYRDKIAEAKRAYREANRDKIAEIGAALRRWRKDHNCSQVELGELLGLSQRAVSYWERGEVPIDFERIERECPPVMEAFA